VREVTMISDQTFSMQRGTNEIQRLHTTKQPHVNNLL